MSTVRHSATLLSLLLATSCGDKTTTADDTAEAACTEEDQLYWYVDADGDSHGDPLQEVLDCDKPTGHVSLGDDCDDTNPAVHPVAAEVCNELDDDCDGLIDDEDPDVNAKDRWYADADGDGFGDAGTSLLSCEQPSGYIVDDTDCDDTAPAINPDATEVCDEGSLVDEDCDGRIDDKDDSTDPFDMTLWLEDLDGDGFGNDDAATLACAEPPSTVVDGGDCDDTDPLVNPLATEICNDLDDDCDGLIDDDDGDLDTSTATTWYADTDGDGYGDPDSDIVTCDQPANYLTDASDCDDSDEDVSPAGLEVCNEVDDDCDGLTDDEDSPVTGTRIWFADSDGDGYGDPDLSTYACTQPSSYVSDSSDCDDTASTANPAAAEDCSNGTDDDCDGLADCEDGGCYSACTETDCSDGSDNDGDGDTDCEDSDCTGVSDCAVTAKAVRVDGARGQLRARSWNIARWSTYNGDTSLTTWGLHRLSIGFAQSGTVSYLSGQARVYAGSALQSTCTWTADQLEMDRSFRNVYTFNDEFDVDNVGHTWTNLQLNSGCGVSSFPTTWMLVPFDGRVVAPRRGNFITNTTFVSGSYLLSAKSAVTTGPNTSTWSSTGWASGPGSTVTTLEATSVTKTWDFSQIRTGTWVYP